MCLPCKEIEDQQMGIVAAQFYARVVADMNLPLKHSASALFYAESLAAQREVAKYLIFNSKLNREQTDRLIEQTKLSCYRAEKFEQWALMPDSEIRDRVDDWTPMVLGWRKNDQDFFTTLLNEVGDWYEFAKDGTTS